MRWLILMTVMLAAPVRATCLAGVSAQGRVVLAADSLRRAGRNETQLGCKLAVAGPRVVGVAGLSEGDIVLRRAAEISERAASLEEAAREIAELLKDEAGLLAKEGRELRRTLTDESGQALPVFTVQVGAWESGRAELRTVAFPWPIEGGPVRPVQHGPENLRVSGENEVARLIGYDRSVGRAWLMSPEQVARELVILAAVSRPDQVAGPLSCVVVDERGARWLQRGECE